MSGSSTLVAVVVGIAVVALLAGVQWALADFVLDRFGALADWWRRGRRPEHDAT
jgi:hypothetical protein